MGPVDPLLLGAVFSVICGLVAWWASCKVKPWLGFAIAALLLMVFLAIWLQGVSDIDQAIWVYLNAMFNSPVSGSAGDASAIGAISRLTIALMILGPSIVAALVGSIIGWAKRRRGAVGAKGMSKRGGE